MAVLLPKLGVIEEIAAALRANGAPRVEVMGPWGSGKAALALQTAQALGHSMLVVTPGRIEAEGVYEDLCTFAGQDACALLPAWEVLPNDVMDPADDIVAERMDALMRLAMAREAGRPIYMACSVRALMQRVVKRERLVGGSVAIAEGEEYDLDDLVERLVERGYRREVMVEQRGEISVRGGILDIFPISAELPYRIEFFGDEVESIRVFEPETQRSLRREKTVQILPRSEKAMLREQQGANLSDVLDYFPGDTLVVIDEPLAVRGEGANTDHRVGDNPFFLSWETTTDSLQRFSTLYVAQLAYDALAGAPPVAASMQSISGWPGSPEGFWNQLREWNEEHYSVVVICNNPGERKRLHELMEGRGYRPGAPGFDLRLEIGRLHAGFASPTDRMAVLSEREIFGRHYVRRTRRRFEAGETITAFSDLRAGDYIVHAIHGIGRYEGLRRFEGKGGDFLCLRYSGGDTLYVPASEIDQVQKFIGGDGVIPKIDKLGGASWARTKKRVKKAVKDMTEELVRLYAARQAEEGHPFGPDTPWQREFEDAFEYDETPDQARAIDDVKKDMELPRPMDRLICGDVGYGKTEVALRAAFKAVMGGRQAAVLVPTTVLAQQHYSTFAERLADFPIKVDVLSRFRTAHEQKMTIDRVKAGEVDIIVGTHRLLSKDIAFKNLGVLIIDEEQRFGVAQKEKIKQMKTYVDVLTMSATPIPRTLHLSLMGTRDMSVINTAPNDRLPIHTCIDAFDEGLIKEAIQRELAREGQVFFLHNRVQTIEAMAGLIQKLVPEARIGIGHGQMGEHRLERVMTAFIRKELDVLVCTTIIGSGLDIPNANTIIVNRADQFGLSELYQLRGRVGRYKHRAFAYLLIPGDRVPSEDAQKRLKALEEFSSLGSGFRIAMRDMEIRGCGNILGGEQHGHIAAVGYDTYTNLIMEAVAELKGQTSVRRVLPPLEFGADAYIPENYVPSEAQKITLYKRIAGILSVEEAEEMQDELRDRFGRPPAPMKRLIDVMRVRALAADAGIKTMSANAQAVKVEFASSERLGRSGRASLKERYGDRLEFSWQGTPAAKIRMKEGEDPLGAAENLVKFLGEL